MADNSDVAGSPYPGLRPFQEFESAYFYGRQSQVAQIIERLQHAQFVAVIGGSGSGKSSLILAGVVPRLRTFALNDAGDFWVPVIATPGTNHVGSESPLTRLASKFCAVLKRLDEQEQSQRLEDCVDLLRKSNGFGLMVAKYSRDLADAQGLDPSSANFLLVIDQFEELFHPSNHEQADCEALVNRVLDNVHDRQAHTRVFVVITMRSEYLSCCAQYLDLPDAINKASYLVRRLDEHQIAEAVERPSARYLRLLTRLAGQRSRNREDAKEGSTSSLPERCTFDQTVSQILLAHAEALRGNPDHLPLLQHLLYRLWETASARIKASGLQVPNQVTLDDLTRATLRDPDDPIQLRPEKGDNCLEECLEKWAERIFGSYTPDRQELLRNVFRALAFKEPNAGTYTQQRVPFSDLVQLLGVPDVPALRQFLEPWLTPHAYLYWDDESRTLKVAHEALIRGWGRFHRWIDDDDESFQEYVRLLGECQLWQEKQRESAYLVDGSRLKRLMDINLQSELDDPRALTRFARLLDIHRDGKKLASVTPVVREFLQLSVKRQQDKEAERAQRLKAERLREEQEKERVQREQLRELERAHEEKQKSTRRRALGVTLTVIAISAILLLYSEYRLSTKERMLHRAYALASETTLASDSQLLDLDSMQIPLRNILVGIWHRDEGNKVHLNKFMRVIIRLTNRGDRVDGIERTSVLAEMRTAAALQGALKFGVWPVQDSSPGPAAIEATRCTLEGAPEEAASAAGTARVTFYPTPNRGADRGVIHVLRHDGSALLLRGVLTANATGKVCKNLFPDPIYRLEAGPTARLAMDSNYGHVLVRTGNRNARNDQESYMVQRYDIVWPYGQDRAPRVQQYGLVTSAPYANMIWANEEPFVLLPSVVRTELSAFDLDLGDKHIRLFHLEPLPIKETIEAKEETKELRTAAKGSVCAKLESQLERDEQEAATSAMWEDSDDNEVVCVRVTPRTSPNTNTVSVFKFAAGLDPENKRVAVLANVDFGAEPITKVRLGKPDTPRDGWIIARSGETERWLGTPWRVEAWQRLACQVYQQDKGQDLPRYKTVYDLVRGSTRPTGANDGIKMNGVCPRLSSPNSSLSAKN